MTKDGRVNRRQEKCECGRYRFNPWDHAALLQAEERVAKAEATANELTIEPAAHEWSHFVFANLGGEVAHVDRPDYDTHTITVRFRQPGWTVKVVDEANPR